MCTEVTLNPGPSPNCPEHSASIPDFGSQHCSTITPTRLC